MEKRIYIVDDEQNIRNLIKMFLLKEGFAVEDFDDGSRMLKRFEEAPADLLIMDILMPAIDGYALCSAVRAKSSVPVIFVSARDAEADRIAGFMLGGDDYITKPFSPVELCMRVKAIFNRTAGKNEDKDIDSCEMGNVTVYPQQKKAICEGREMQLTLLELDLILYLMQNRNKAVSRDELLNQVWKFKEETDSRATDDTVKRLRKKLEAAKADIFIETVWGFGFQLKKKEA